MEDSHALTGRNRLEGAANRLRSLAASVLIAVLAGSSVGAGESSTNEPARVTVSGFGLVGNREMVRLLRNFQVDGRMPPMLDRAFVEDTALVLLARANEEGFLGAALEANLTLSGGSPLSLVWTQAQEVTLPGDFSAHAARFTLHPGVRFHYQDLQFEGLQAISKREATSYFLSGDGLLNLRGNRIFSPTALKSSLAALRDAYARAGFQHAVVATNQVLVDEASGEVRVTVEVREGVPTLVRSVEVKVIEDGQEKAEGGRTLRPGVPYSELWRQDTARQLQTGQYVQGYPDTTVEFSELGRQTNATSIQLDLSALVRPGRRVLLRDVQFQGNELTRTSVLESRAKLNEGEPLDRVAAEKFRQRLARLSVFDSVRLRYDEVGETERDVIYELREAKPISLSVLAGYGSYELLRGGLEFEHRNVFGLAHHFRLRGLQSFKATKGDLLYTVPEIVGENVNLFFEGSRLRREEVSFTREEFGGSLGVQKRLVPIQTDASVRYDYQFLNALDRGAASAEAVGVDEARSAAFVFELNRDRRDHPLLPRRGLRLSSRAEWASAGLGGDVDYQRFILGASYHLDLQGGRLLHLGVTHGLSFTWGGTPEQLPFNKRFFPGGESSVRGYQEGEASPLDRDGDQLGAETYTLGNVEFEQLLTKTWSLVAFFDAVGFAKNRADYPWDEGLYSVGGGVRWRTPLGPVRLEYGRNLNRRVHDPAGTLHFSVGFPF